MTKYEITFDRIGRTKNIVTSFKDIIDADDLAEKIFLYARKYLSSNDYIVTVDLDSMSGAIKGGRYGNFTILDKGEIAVPGGISRR